MSIKKEELLKLLPQYKKDFTPQIDRNLDDLVVALAYIRELWAKPMIITSGWRPTSYNAQVGGSTRSNHILGLAADVADPKGELGQWLKANPEILHDAGVWCEDPAVTTGWVHFQIVPPKSGKRFFKP
jgi:hypothetical protein